ncbi:uncharacterized protein [Gossypium hirsutum]|uniref:Uncharacterized protein isoform X2 n=1 Tax=Gossypium hirsutum TaxID=3635 RepID=A0ABM3B4C3_GOSHI|nr:uncharacterized protein LOC107887505 isoform X2 [Gossypium hirsutum]
MATDSVPADDTPRHSLNTEEAVYSQGLGSGTPTVHYFAKHDTIKLAAHNYLLWKHQILLILEGSGLEGFVLGTVAVSPAFLAGSEGQLVENPVFLAHKKQDKFLASWLLSTVTDEVLVHLTAATTSFDVWTAIERRFGATSTLKISSMRHALYSIKKSNLTITEYLSKVKTLCDNLTAVGSLVTEAEQVSVILTGLSVEYESVCVFASASPISLDLLTDMLLDCKTRQLVLLTEVPLQANLATRSSDHIDVQSFLSLRKLSMGTKGLVEVGLVDGLVEVVEAGLALDLNASCVGKLAILSKIAIIVLMKVFLVLLILLQSTILRFLIMDNFSLHVLLLLIAVARFLHQLLFLLRFLLDLLLRSPLISFGIPILVPLIIFHLKHPISLMPLPTQVQVMLLWETTGTTLLEGHMHEGLYPFQFSKTSSTKISSSAQTFCPPLLNNTQISSSSIWHNRLGHPCNNTLAHVLKSCNVSFRQNSLPSICTACQLEKAHKLPFGSSHTIYFSPFELVVTDVWGLAHVTSNGFTYYVSFVDMFSRYTWIYFLKSKSDVLQCFLDFHQMVKT